ncbi:DUF3558 family protein [Rhodococcus phenolicus]|uniref:DUF3558 family protein n=1 Tax=Rhodococcus phenolicus TaxID=263849 RepID=UPI00083715BC|nr:DUF3558 family protein [Rhodococcus phenolicus]
MRAALNAVLLATLVVTVAGCSLDTEIRGHATKTVPAALFDPCTLPDDALHSIGVDPETESPDFMGVQSEGWEVCGWEADWFYITVFVTDATVEEFRARPRTTDFRSVDLGNREASTFRSTADSQRGLCDLVYASSRGTVLIRAGAQGTELMRGDGMREDPCALVLRAATTLDPYIPE